MEEQTLLLWRHWADSTFGELGGAATEVWSPKYIERAFVLIDLFALGTFSCTALPEQPHLALWG